MVSFAFYTLILVSAVTLIAAAAHDLLARTVPNGMALTLAIAGAALRLLQGDAGTGLLAATAIFIVAAVCWRRGWMGGGDVKLLGAAALVVPPPLVLSFITAVSLIGAGLAVLYLIARYVMPPPRAARPRTLWARGLRAEQWRIRRGGPLPYACAIAAGGLLVLL